MCDQSPKLPQGAMADDDAGASSKEVIKKDLEKRKYFLWPKNMAK